MNIVRPDAAAWFAAIALCIFTSGCGARSVAPMEGAQGDAQAPETAMASSVDPDPLPIARSEVVRPPLPPELSEVVDLFESGAGEEIVRAYVATASTPYDLSLEEIKYLRDIGIPDGVIAAMMRRGGELRAAAVEAASLQTNLVSAVEHLKEAFNTAQQAAANGGMPHDPGPEYPPAPAGEPVPVAAVQPPPEAPEPVQQFYSQLAPYGTWYQVPSHGWVWQPSVVVVNPVWVPYRHGGRWIWTDYGWYWASDYSWGWAPFHYGRWYSQPGLGWCWVPGTVWGPSWVTWRYSSGHVGWAPLPPACGWSSGVGLTWHGSRISVGFGFGLAYSHYTFVPTSRFCYRNVGHHAVPATQVTTVYENSTVINNVIVGNNNTIVNQGVGYSKIASVVPDVPKARVETLPREASRPLRVDRLDRSGESPVIYKPAPVDRGEGRPATLAAEVRPTLSSPARSGASFASGSPRTPQITATPVATRPVATPGRPAPTSSSPTPAGSIPQRQVLGSPTSGAPNPRAPITTTRPSTVPNRPAPTSQQDPVAVMGPSRQTTPVPLGDPSRNLPSHLQPAAPQPVSPPKPVTPSTRPSPSMGTPTQVHPPAPQHSVPRPVQTLPAPAAPSGRTFTPTPRQPSVFPTPPATPPSAVRQPVTVPSAPATVPQPPRVVPSAPTPRSSISVPRPSAPAARPVVSAPSPSFAAPRPVVSSPAPARSVSASPAPSRNPVAAPSAAPARPSRN
ncbi:MAG: hypothetical protein KF833_14985 [Verrucomicrobiae bacterium]|nr:hypothetical protein [Verrucomicrobiae bacterium]